MSDYTNPAYDRACQIIGFWYRKGEHVIVVSPQVFADYLSGLCFLTREVCGPCPTIVSRRRLVYKTAIVYVPDGWY